MEGGGGTGAKNAPTVTRTTAHAITLIELRNNLHTSPNRAGSRQSFKSSYLHSEHAHGEQLGCDERIESGL